MHSLHYLESEQNVDPSTLQYGMFPLPCVSGANEMLQQPKSKVEGYLANLNPASMTGNWKPEKTWHRIHGDTKSSTGGKWHMETMRDSAGKFRVKLVEDNTSIHSLSYDAEPSFATIVHDMKEWRGV